MKFSVKVGNCLTIMSIYILLKNTTVFMCNISDKKSRNAYAIFKVKRENIL